MILKKKRNVQKVTQHMADVVEMNLEEITEVRFAQFDIKMSRVDVELEEDGAEVELTELYRAVMRTGWFNVLGIG